MSKLQYRVRNLLELYDIKIDYVKLKWINGFLFLWNTIVINSNKSQKKQMFTLLHELWHYIYWDHINMNKKKQKKYWKACW